MEIEGSKRVPIYCWDKNLRTMALVNYEKWMVLVDIVANIHALGFVVNVHYQELNKKRFLDATRNGPYGRTGSAGTATAFPYEMDFTREFFYLR